MDRAARGGQVVDQGGHRAVFGVDAVEIEQVPSQRVGIVVEGVLDEVIGQRFDDRFFAGRMAEHAQVVGADFAGAQRPQHPAAHGRAVEIPRGNADQRVVVVEDAQRRQAGPQRRRRRSAGRSAATSARATSNRETAPRRQPLPIVGVGRQFVQGCQADRLAWHTLADRVVRVRAQRSCHAATCDCAACTHAHRLPRQLSVTRRDKQVVFRPDANGDRRRVRRRVLPDGNADVASRQHAGPASRQSGRATWRRNLLLQKQLRRMSAGSPPGLAPALHLHAERPDSRLTTGRGRLQSPIKHLWSSGLRHPPARVPATGTAPCEQLFPNRPIRAPIPMNLTQPTVTESDASAPPAPRPRQAVAPARRGHRRGRGSLCRGSRRRPGKPRRP